MHPYQHPNHLHTAMPPSSYSFAHSSTQHNVPPQSSHHAPNQFAQEQHVMTSLQQPILTHDEYTNNNTTMIPPKTPGKTYSTIKKVTPRTILKKKKSSSTAGIFSSNKMSSTTPDNSMSTTTTSPTPTMSYLNDSCDNTSPPSTDNVVSSSKGSVSFSPQVQYHYPESSSVEQDVPVVNEEKRDELSPVDAIFAAGELVYFHICPFDTLSSKITHIQHIELFSSPYHQLM